MTFFLNLQQKDLSKMQIQEILLYLIILYYITLQIDNCTKSI